MQFTDCQLTDHHYYSTDRDVALADCISAPILNSCNGHLSQAAFSFAFQITLSAQ